MVTNWLRLLTLLSLILFSVGIVGRVFESFVESEEAGVDISPIKKLEKEKAILDSYLQKLQSGQTLSTDEMASLKAMNSDNYAQIMEKNRAIIDIIQYNAVVLNEIEQLQKFASIDSKSSIES